MQKAKGDNTSVTELNLGFEHGNLAELYKNGHSGYAKSFEQALVYYNKAINYLETLIKSDLEAFRLESRIEAYKSLGGAYEEKGNLTFDVDFLIQALDYYKIAIGLKSDLGDVQHYIKKCNTRILEIKKN